MHSAMIVALVILFHSEQCPFIHILNEIITVVVSALPLELGDSAETYPNMI